MDIDPRRYHLTAKKRVVKCCEHRLLIRIFPFVVFPSACPAVPNKGLDKSPCFVLFPQVRWNYLPTTQKKSTHPYKASSGYKICSNTYTHVCYSRSFTGNDTNNLYRFSESSRGNPGEQAQASAAGVGGEAGPPAPGEDERRHPCRGKR